MKVIKMEALKIAGMIMLLFGVYAVMGNDDYHKMFDKPSVIRYDCDMLMGGWHPDVPTEVMNECRKTTERYVNVKTYKD
jgi:hypothetical protein